MPVPGPKSVVRSAATATMGRVFPRSRAAPGPVAPGDGGLFGPDSVTWQVHSNFSMFVGGIRALIVQALHPLAMAGVAEHSAFRTDPLGRLHRTAAFIAATTYGTTEEADAAIARVRAIHERVRGVARDGRPYAANDPDLLAWVHHVEAQSFLLAYQRIGPGLSAADADRYVCEMARLGERMGVPSPVTTAHDLHAWVRDHPEQRSTPEARAAVRFLILPPLPLAARAPYAVLLGAAISLVPLRQRLALGLVIPGPVAGRLASEPIASALVSTLGWSLGPSPALEHARARVRALRSEIA
jgi:uncharacterized protein (DUF2236 family)